MVGVYTNCPRCRANHTELKSVKLLSDQTNAYGRRELTYQAEHEDVVTWNKQTERYTCHRCGLTFTFQQGVTQTF